MDKLNEAGVNIIAISTDIPKRVQSILKTENTEHHTIEALYIPKKQDKSIVEVTWRLKLNIPMVVY